MMKTIMLLILFLLSLGASSNVSFAKPAPPAKKTKIGNVIYTETRNSTLEEHKEASVRISIWFSEAIQVPEARYDASVIYNLLMQNKNWLGWIDSYFDGIIFRNKKNYYFPTDTNRAQQDVWCLYDGYRFFKIMCDTKEKRPIRVYWYCVSDDSQMAIFEKPKEMPQVIRVPKKLVQTMSPEDQQYVDELLAVVNENMAFIGYVPFFKPDLHRFIGELDNQTVGRIIPEKYLLTGETLDRVKKDLGDFNKKYEYIDFSHLELQKRLGHPVYELYAYEGHEQTPDYLLATHSEPDKVPEIIRNLKPGHLKHDAGYPFTRYRGMRYVDSLVQLQPGWDVLRDKKFVLETLRNVQYKRAQKSLSIIEKGLQEELALQKNNPKRRAVLNGVIRDVRAVSEKWNKMLQTAIYKNEFLFSLVNPGGDRDDNEKAIFEARRTTWGHRGRVVYPKSRRRTPEEWAAFRARVRKEKEKKKNEQKTRGSE